MKNTYLLCMLLGLGITVNAQSYTWTTYYTPPTTFANSSNSLWMVSGNTLIQFDKSALCFNRVNISDSIAIFNQHQTQFPSSDLIVAGDYPFFDTVSYDGQNWGTIPCTATFEPTYMVNVGGTSYYYSFKDSSGNYYDIYDSVIIKYNSSGITVYDTVNQMFSGNIDFQIDFFSEYTEAIDLNGNLWITMPELGILKFNGQTFTLYDSSTLGNLSNFYPTGTFVDPYNNDIFFPVEVDSFPHYYLYSGSTWYYDSIPYTGDAFGDITAMFFGPTAAYFCTASGIYSYTGTGYTKVVLPAPFNNTDSSYTYTVAADPGGYYWLMVNNLLFLFNGTSFTAYPDNQAVLADNYVLNQVIDNSGNQWLGYGDPNMGEINATGVHNFTANSGTDGVMAIDSQGRVWHSFYTYPSYFDTIDHQVTDSAGGFYESFVVDKSNTVWAVTGNTVARYTGQAFVPFSVPLADSIYTGWLTCLAIDSNNVKWVSVGSPSSGAYIGAMGGVIRYDDTTCTKFDSTNSPVPNDIECLSVDPQNRIWVGTHLRGVMIYDGSTWTVYNTSNSGIPGNDIESFYFKNGLAYISTQDNGATIFDGTNWTSFTRSNAPLDNDCESIIIDGNCNLWIGQECGLAEMSGLCGNPAGFNLVQGTVYQPDGATSSHELVYLMQYDSAANAMKTIESTYTDGNGYYHFLTALPVVYVHALPHTSDTTGGIMPVYEDTSIVQQGATGIVMDSTVVTQNIWSVEAISLSGPTILTGVVNDPQGRSVRGLRLFLMSAGQPVATTVTATDGTFSFHGLSPGIYKIWVDKMGIDNALAPSVDFTSVNAANAICELTSTQLKLLSVGINEMASNSIRVYPNPTTGLVNIASQGIENADVSVTDIMGRELMHATASAGTQKLDLSTLGSGVYILHLQSGTDVYTQRLVLSK